MKGIFLIMVSVLFFACSNSKSGNENDAGKSAMLVKDTVFIRGMHCEMCVSSIEKGIGEVEGVEYVKAVLDDSLAVVHYNSSKTGPEEIESAIASRGYSVKEQ